MLLQYNKYMQIQAQNQQTKQPIHRKIKYEIFTNASTKRKLSVSNYSTKDAKMIDKNQIIANTENKKQIDDQQSKKKQLRRLNATISTPNTIENNYIKIQAMRQEQKSKWRVNPNNLMAFFPTYTTLVDNQAHHIYLHKTISTHSKSPEKFNVNTQLKIQPIYSERHYNKLAPLRKISKKQRQRKSEQKCSRGYFNSFFNVQKLSIKPMIQNSSQSPQDKKNKINYMTFLLQNEKALVLPKKYLQQISNKQTQNNENQIQNQNQTQIIDKSLLKQNISNQTETNIESNSNSFLLKTATKMEIPMLKSLKPFTVPFDRYYYFDFIWKVAFSNQLRVQFAEMLPKKYKIYIGPGNNSMLIKTLFKRRESWWAITDKIEQANFIWTQIKVGNIFSSQKNGQIPKQLQYEGDNIQDIFLQKKNSLQIKRNCKILNKVLLQKWLSYFDKNKQTEEKLSQNFLKRNKLFKTPNFKTISTNDNQKIKIHNHFQRNYVLGNKKALFATMKKYYEVKKQQVFDYLPLTFHIQNGLDDKQYFKFLQYFYKKDKEAKQSQKGNKTYNIWIVKPGQFTNRGNGITVCKNLQQIKSILKNKKKLDNGNSRTYIVQQYLDKPFLYCKRKFDIRHYMLITCVNGQIKGYWYQLGYIRTTSYEYSVKNSLSSVHLTNDAVQKLLPDYGKYEKGNKLSYDEFQKYLQRQYKGKHSFYKTIYPQMKKIASDSMRASGLLIDPERKSHNFEIFGFDFMIDSNFHPWLIQINTNPCLELSCPVLMDVIPGMVENALKIGVDSVLIPPYTFTQKRSRFSDNILEQNKFQLLYDSNTQQQQLNKLYQSGEVVNLNYKQLQKDQDEVYQDDGVELQD